MLNDTDVVDSPRKKSYKVKKVVWILSAILAISAFCLIGLLLLAHALGWTVMAVDPFAVPGDPGDERRAQENMARGGGPSGSQPLASRELKSLAVGMDMNQAKLILNAAKANVYEFAYPMPWSDDKGNRGVYRYYILADGTCLQIEVKQQGGKETITALVVGIKGKGYPGKLEWFENEEKGRIKATDTVDLNSY